MIGWVEILAAGPQPRVHPILEVAMVVTDDQLVEKITFVVPVRPLKRQWPQWRESMDPQVALSHKKIRLLDAVLTGMNVVEVEQGCVSLCHSFGTRGQMRLGAVDPDLTRRFLRAQMRSLPAWFSSDDVSVQRLRERANRPAPAAKAQRALPQLRATVNEARKLLAELGELDPALVIPEPQEEMEDLVRQEDHAPSGT